MRAPSDFGARSERVFVGKDPMKDTKIPTQGEKFLAERRRRKFSQLELGQRAGVTARVVSAIESGEGALSDCVRRVAETLNLDYDSVILKPTEQGFTVEASLSESQDEESANSGQAISRFRWEQVGDHAVASTILSEILPKIPKGTHFVIELTTFKCVQYEGEADEFAMEFIIHAFFEGLLQKFGIYEIRFCIDIDRGSTRYSIADENLPNGFLQRMSYSDENRCVDRFLGDSRIITVVYFDSPVADGADGFNWCLTSTLSPADLRSAESIQKGTPQLPTPEDPPTFRWEQYQRSELPLAKHNFTGPALDTLRKYGVQSDEAGYLVKKSLNDLDFFYEHLQRMDSDLFFVAFYKLLQMNCDANIVNPANIESDAKEM